MQFHDPIRQISFIQQALSQNRKSVAFFIGAGCPLSVRIETTKPDGTPANIPLIWDVAGLTDVIGERLSSEASTRSRWAKLVAAAEEDGEDKGNIEILLSKMRALRSVAGKGKVRDLQAEELEALDREVCSVIAQETSKSLPNKDTPYHNLAIWCRSIRRDRPVHLFTTNYDLLLEQAMEESSAPYFDGFVGTREAFFDLGAVEDETTLPSRWTRVWKIHGSLNWRLANGKDVVRSDKVDSANSHLIYPSHLKYDQSRKMPYLAMLDRLKSFITNSSSILFTCGYSFSDEHINDNIIMSLESNPTAHVYAFLYGELHNPKYELARKSALATPNLSVLAFDKAIIGRTEAAWQEGDFDMPALPPGVLIKDGSKVSLKLGEFAALGNLLRSMAGGASVDAS